MDPPTPGLCHYDITTFVPLFTTTICYWLFLVYCIPASVSSTDLYSRTILLPVHYNIGANVCRLGTPWMYWTNTYYLLWPVNTYHYKYWEWLIWKKIIIGTEWSSRSTYMHVENPRTGNHLFRCTFLEGGVLLSEEVHLRRNKYTW